METHKLITELQAGIPDPEALINAVRALHAVRSYANAVQQQLQEQQLTEPNTAVDTQLEMLGAFYKAMSEYAQQSADFATRVLTNCKHLPNELAKRGEVIRSLDASI